jgi:type II secretory pathway pseudopilin PulG
MMETKRLLNARRPRRRAESGFSMIEALIAAGILLIIAVGLLPVFTRAVQDNVTGNDASQATNNSRTRVEEMLGVPFDNLVMTVPVGSTQRQTIESWAQGTVDQTGDANEGWWPNAPTNRGTLLWTRTTRVRQYSISALDDGDLDRLDDGLTGEDELPGNTQPTFVHLKEIEVTITNPKQGGVLGSGQGILLRGVRPF